MKVYKKKLEAEGANFRTILDRQEKLGMILPALIYLSLIVWLGSTWRLYGQFLLVLSTACWVIFYLSSFQRRWRKVHRTKWGKAIIERLDFVKILRHACSSGEIDETETRYRIKVISQQIALFWFRANQEFGWVILPEDLHREAQRLLEEGQALLAGTNHINQLKQAASRLRIFRSNPP